MPFRDHVLAIDQGTTSTRAILFDGNGKSRASASRELRQHCSHPGWVEHDPEQIWQDTISVVRAALAVSRSLTRAAQQCFHKTSF